MVATTQRRAGVYGRQSHGKETSVDDQVRIGQERCTTLDAAVARVYRDTVSASRFGTKARGDWPQLVADVAAGQLDLIWLWDASRGDRTPESWFAFLGSCRERGVLIHAERDRRTYDMRSPRDWKTLAESGVDAAYESEIRSEDVRRGVAGAAAAGKPPGGLSPHGYERVYDRHNRKEFTQKPDANAPIVHEIITRIGRRDPVQQIMDDLNRRGIPSPNGGVWRSRSVRRVALNPAYAALRDHGEALHPGNWPAIVTRKAWEDARAVLGEPDRKTSAPGRLKWLLSYLAVSTCVDSAGDPVPVNARLGKRGRKDHYRCLATDGCTSIGVWEADEFVTRVVLARLARADARALFTTDDAARTAALGEVAAIEAEARELEAEARGGMRPALVAAADAGIQERLRDAQRRVSAASGNAAALELLGEDEFTAATARPRWDALSVAARRTVIVALIERVAVCPADVRLTRWSTDDDRLTLAAERIEITWRHKDIAPSSH